MDPVIDTILDPKKIAKTLGLKWTHPEFIRPGSNGDEIETSDETYNFTLVDKKNLVIVLQVDVNDLHTIILEINEPSSIKFTNISKILYNPKMKAIMLEAVIGKHYHEMSIHSDGKFYLGLDQPTSSLPDSSLTIMAENLGLVPAKIK
jgi:hypothetical protein